MGHVRIAWIIYFVSFAVFVFTFNRAADRLAGSSATRAPLRQSMKLWLLVPLLLVWPLGVLVWGWLVRQYVEWAYNGGAA